MKNVSTLLFLSLLWLSGCDSIEKEEFAKMPSPNADSKTEIAALNQLLKKYDVPSQVFNVASDLPSRIRGKRGTTISVIPQDLETETGEAPKGNISVELKEIMNQSQLLRSGAQTISNGMLLVSGGAYYINLSADGKQLKLKEGKSLSVAFPKISPKPMSLFYGEKDSLNLMNWQETDVKFVARMDTSQQLEPENSTYEDKIDAIFYYINDTMMRPLTDEEKRNRGLTDAQQKRIISEIEERNKLEATLYEIVQVRQFGWINCDYFFKNPNPTQLLYAFNPKDSINAANIYLVFKNLNAVMQNFYYPYTTWGSNDQFSQIPLGAETRLIAVASKNGKTYSYKTDLKIKANETVQLALVETSPEELKSLFDLN